MRWRLIDILKVKIKKFELYSFCLLLLKYYFFCFKWFFGIKYEYKVNYVGEYLMILRRMGNVLFY